MTDHLNKEKIILGLTKEKLRDYSYFIAFFLIFAFFIFFVIRPNLKSIFEANLKIEKLKKENNFYEYQIENIVNIQEKFIKFRNDLSLIDNAITSKPEVNQLINDITKTVQKNQFVIENFSLSNLNLKDVSRNDALKTILFSLDIIGIFPDFVSLINKVHQQKRLKLIKAATITKEVNKNLIISTESAQFSTNSSNLKINLLIEGYYL